MYLHTIKSLVCHRKLNYPTQLVVFIGVMSILMTGWRKKQAMLTQSTQVGVLIMSTKLGICKLVTS